MLLARNRERFEGYLSRAKAAYNARDYVEAAALVQIAAGCAERRHAGFFYSAELETMLRNISARTVTNIEQRSRTGKQGRRKVLHVLTQAYAVGGHTRLVWNWIETDKSSEHHVALTQHGTSNLPPRLGEAAKNSGGSLRLLDRRGSLLRIAHSLRRIASDVDFIVLNVHPEDVVPTLAFGAGFDHPPIAYLNHADHVFWIGSEICDINLNIRESAVQLATARRGIPLQRNVLLPIPLSDAGKITEPRNLARRRLSIADDDVMILSVASAHKFLPHEDADFAKIHLPILERHPNVRFVVVGPSPDDPYWSHWARATNGRLQAVDQHADTSIFLAAADIYCDSCPEGSNTSLLEAGLAGVPCISWRPDSLYTLLSCDDIAFEGHHIEFVDKVKYIDRLHFLIGLPNRADVGAQLSKSIVQTHAAEGWLDRLNAAYVCGVARSAERPHRPFENTETVERYDEILASVQETNGPFAESLLRSLPLAMRLQYLLRRNANMLELVRAVVPISVVRELKTIGNLTPFR